MFDFTMARGSSSVTIKCGVSWPSGLAYRTQVLVLAARHLIIIASLHPGVKWVPVRAELVDKPRPYMRCNCSN